MSTTKSTDQMRTKVSIPKEELRELIGYATDLKKNDLRTCIVLFTMLEGFQPPRAREYDDPRNFRKIDFKTVAVNMELSEDTLRNCVDRLVKKRILEYGKGPNGKGYRFTF